jgi:transcriptional regulator with XRE-family HTH domain
MREEPMKKINKGLAGRLKQIQGSMTLRVFAEKIGIGQSTLHNYLHGRDPKGRFLELVAKKLNVNVNWLLTGVGHKYLTNYYPKLEELKKQVAALMSVKQDVSDNKLRAKDRLNGILQMSLEMYQKKYDK